MTDQDAAAAGVMKLLRESVGKRARLESTTTLFGNLSICGDDAAELLGNLHDHFGVDLSEFQFDMHFLSEAYSCAELLFLPVVVVAHVYRRHFSRRTPEQGEGLIPITVEQLIEAVRMKRWPGEWSRPVARRQSDVAAKPE
jgi:hypothetical protein